MASKQAITPDGYTGWLDYKHIGAKHDSAVGIYAKTWDEAYKDMVYHAHYYANLGDCTVQGAKLQGVCPTCHGNRGESVGKRVRRWVPCKVCKGEGVVGPELHIDAIEMLMQADPGTKWDRLMA